MDAMKKENAVADFVKMIRQSWTYERLTPEEISVLNDLFENAENVVAGGYKTRWEQMHLIYYAFLRGAGYDPLHWRERED